MNPEIKARWVAALRSGDYKQGEGTLRRVDGTVTHCCLGVLCELAVQDGVGRMVESKLNQDPSSIIKVTFFGDRGDETSTDIPPNVQAWAGLVSDDLEDEARYPSNPEVEWTDEDGNVGRQSLAILNDGGVPFDKIAQIIEESL